MATKKHCFRCKKRTTSKINIRGEKVCTECNSIKDIYYETPWAAMILMSGLLLLLIAAIVSIIWLGYMLGKILL